MKEMLAEIKALRQDLEVGAAINIIEGVNTIETLAVLGHWIQTRRAPTAQETLVLERVARERWAKQVRHTLSVLRADGTQLDEKMADLADMLARVNQTRTAAVAPKKKAAGKKAKGK